ncbi:MAG: VOC family protein [Methanomassiliicoccaceae archaeon]|nr:VOC family protein [Methanomassiliicoccaceae archaeon]
MPLGDPGGGNFEYTTEGLPLYVKFAEIPVSDMDRALRFYRDVMRMKVISQSDGVSVLEMNEKCRIALVRRPDGVGKDTGIYLAVDEPFVFNRRMSDEGVIITRRPQKGSLGMFASFTDTEGNTLHVIGIS